MSTEVKVEKPYVSETCGKAFSASRTVAAHRWSHSGEKAHVCETQQLHTGTFTLAAMVLG